MPDLDKAPKTRSLRFASTLSLRMRYAVLGLLFGACFFVGFGYHYITMLATEPVAQTLTLLYNIVLLIGYVSLWGIFSLFFKQRRYTPTTTLWLAIVGGLIFFGVSYLLTRGTLSNEMVGVTGFSFETGYPIEFVTLIKMNVLALVEGTYALFALILLRTPVLFKRTRSSQRNWYLMLVLMVVATLPAFMDSFAPSNSFAMNLALVPAIVMMVVNSFRLSWIVFLTFREKIAIIALSVVLLPIFFEACSGLFSEVSDGHFVQIATVFVDYYSLPLSTFARLTFLFGFLYTLTALLSLLFHLPTTSDFQQRAGEIAALHSFSSLANQMLDADKLHATMIKATVQTSGADRAWLALDNPDSTTLEPELVAFHNTSPAQINAQLDIRALYRDLYQSREPLYLEHAPLDHRVKARPGEGMGSLLAVPLLSRDAMLGVLFTTKSLVQGFEDDDIEAISIFAAQASLAMENARLFEEQLEKERLMRELAIAREVQRKLLPQHLPTLPGLQCAASSVSAQEVGGDYYDMLQLDDHTLAFIIADVSGKGTSAAFYMAEMQGIFRSVSRIAPQPADFLYHANVALAGSLEKNVFISVIYGLIDTANEEIVLARAGHCPAAYGGLSGPPRYLRSKGLGLGLDKGPLFKRSLVEERLSIAPGDVFMLYTDGVVECRTPDGEEYGYDRLLRLLDDHRHEDATDLHATLIDDLNSFMGPSKVYDDDLTVLVLKWQGIDFSEMRNPAQLPSVTTALETPSPAVSPDPHGRR